MKLRQKKSMIVSPLTLKSNNNNEYNNNDDKKDDNDESEIESYASSSSQDIDGIEEEIHKLEKRQIYFQRKIHKSKGIIKAGYKKDRLKIRLQLKKLKEKLSDKQNKNKNKHNNSMKNVCNIIRYKPISSQSKLSKH